MANKLLDPIAPGEVLFEESMQPLALSMNALARELAVPTNRINEYRQRHAHDHRRYSAAPGRYYRTDPEL